MKNLSILTITILNSLFSFGQTIEKVYLNPNDSSTNYFIAYKPKGEVRGLLLLLTSFGETPEIATIETDIQNIATKKGYLTAFVSLQFGTQSFFIDSISQSHLDQIIPSIQKRFQLTNKPFYFGGFSLGGSGVVKYAERSYSRTDIIRPNAIFAIDPPLDFERMYYSLENTIRNCKDEISKQEANYFINRLQYEFQSVPQIDNIPFQTISPYSFSDTNQINIKTLVNCPIMLISESDIIWQMEERNRSIYDLNIMDCSLVINSLRLLGNKQAQLVLTTGKGYRKLTGKRNPHSWSILDSEQTIKWLLAH
jgi:hypothetical protein